MYNNQYSYSGKTILKIPKEHYIFIDKNNRRIPMTQDDIVQRIMKTGNEFKRPGTPAPDNREVTHISSPPTFLQHTLNVQQLPRFPKDPQTVTFDDIDLLLNHLEQLESIAKQPEPPKKITPSNN